MVNRRFLECVLIMEIIRILSAILSCCTFLLSNNEIEASSLSNIPEVYMEFSHNTCTVSCNGNSKTFEYNQKPSHVLLDEINDFIGNKYFSVNEINYNNDNNILTINCSHINNNIQCILGINNSFEKIPNIVFDGGYNLFQGINIFRFDGAQYYNLKTYSISKRPSI